MAKKVTTDQRKQILDLLAQGQDRETIAAAVGVTPGQVSAISAHVKMGTYDLPEPSTPQMIADSIPSGPVANKVRKLAAAKSESRRLDPIHLGTDAETEELVYWSPDPASGTPNPHVLVIGESGTGKTYTTSCLVAELAQEGVTSVIFDYGQGFAPATLPREFIDATDIMEIHASRDGVDINPLQVFASDIHGPVNVAQRVADTFGRVYSKIGIQQHAAIRQAVLDVMTEAGIRPSESVSWRHDLPAFATIQDKLNEYAADIMHPQSRYAGTAASHVSTLFVFNTFRANGEAMAWDEILAPRKKARVVVIQLSGLEHSLEKAVTEFLLWNLIGYIESLGPGPLRCFVVLDEAHKLSFDKGSPVEKLLREGRKFGLGLILASQQPEDFSPVAFSNTATKIVFQVGDERSTISRQLHRKIKNNHSFGDLYQLITRLPRGCAYVVSENVGSVVKVASFPERVSRWK